MCDTENSDIDNNSEFEAPDVEAGATIRMPKCAAGVDAKTQAAKSVAAAVVAEAVDDASEGGLAAMDNEPFNKPQVSGMANATRTGDRTAIFCKHDIGGSLKESQDLAKFSVPAATETAAARKKVEIGATKSRPPAARSTSWRSATSRVIPTSVSRFASMGDESKTDAVEDEIDNHAERALSPQAGVMCGSHAHRTAASTETHAAHQRYTWRNWTVQKTHPTRQPGSWCLRCVPCRGLG
ncbi:hypothetical protein HPB51_013593 [Rhipicephalus microplus]|uniref:Uncharacterized protein n=1 Tax=Rhipicephalus microplus TaxID=6941 RepID=A0A9J6DVY2_RHIMP|nr:hypothetical protein HPB51_013593 [Rhipicephalus microplus]